MNAVLKLCVTLLNNFSKHRLRFPHIGQSAVLFITLMCGGFTIKDAENQLHDLFYLTKLFKLTCLFSTD